MQGSAETGNRRRRWVWRLSMNEKCLHRRQRLSSLEMLWKWLLVFVLRIAERRSGMRFCNENKDEVILWIYEAF